MWFCCHEEEEEGDFLARKGISASHWAAGNKRRVPIGRAGEPQKGDFWVLWTCVPLFPKYRYRASISHAPIDLLPAHGLRVIGLPCCARKNRVTD